METFWPLKKSLKTCTKSFGTAKSPIRIVPLIGCNTHGCTHSPPAHTHSHTHTYTVRLSDVYGFIWRILRADCASHAPFVRDFRIQVSGPHSASSLNTQNGSLSSSQLTRGRLVLVLCCHDSKCLGKL